jgi:hypothetical protein
MAVFFHVVRVLIDGASVVYLLLPEVRQRFAYFDRFLRLERLRDFLYDRKRLW